MTHVTPQTFSTHSQDDSNLTSLHKSQNAVVLLSGGLDSVTCLYWAKARYASVTAVSFNYGQRHNSELVAAKAIAENAGVNHRIIDIDIAQLGGSSLTDHSMIVPDGDTDKFPDKKRDEIDNDDNIAIAVRKGDSIKDDFNKALSEIRSNGELARLEQENFGQ